MTSRTRATIRRLAPPTLIFAAGVATGFSLASPVDRGPTPEPGLVAGVDDFEQPPDPASRRRALPRLITSLEERIAELDRRIRRIDEVRVGYDKPTEYKASISEIESRGRMSLMLLREQQGYQRSREELQRKIEELRTESDSL